jgi:hypothetical protein
MRRIVSLGILALIGACVHRPPAINGAPGAPRQPNEYWTPSAKDAARLESALPAPSITAMPASSGRLGVSDVVDLALRNNPATRLS